MVNNSTNINNHLAAKTIEHKKTKIYDVGNPDPCLGHAEKYGGVKPVVVIYIVYYCVLLIFILKIFLLCNCECWKIRVLIRALGTDNHSKYR